MNVRQRMLLPAPVSQLAPTRDTVIRGFALLVSAVVALFALHCPAAATSVQVELPGVSVEADEESDSAKISVPGVSVRVSPPATRQTTEGETVDLSGPWKFRTDPTEVGLAEGWDKPGFDDSSWLSLLVPAFWEDQAIVAGNPRYPQTWDDCGYNGYAWYRLHFTPPEGWEGDEVHFRAGEIHDRDWTYLNGQPIGVSAADDSWEEPRSYRIPPGLLKPGADNVLAIRVFDELSKGGIAVGPVQLVNTSRAAAPGAPFPESRSYSRTRSDIARFGGDVTVGADEKVSGNVVVFGGDATIRGYVTEDVVAMGGTIDLRPGSRVDGDVVVVGGRIDRAPGAFVAGDIVEAVPGVNWPRGAFPREIAPALPWGIAGVAATVLGLLAWGFIALLGVLLMKDRLVVMGDALPAHPARAALYGLIGFALIPAAVLTAVVASALACVLLAITIVGIPLIPAVLAALLALIVAGGLLVVAGVIAVWFSLGKATFSLFSRHDIHPVWAVLVGVALIAIASQIPVLGPLVVVTIIIFGFGLAIMTGLGAGSHWAPRRLGFKVAETVPEPVPNVPPAVPSVPPTVPPDAADRADDAGRAAPDSAEEPPQEADEEERPES